MAEEKKRTSQVTDKESVVPPSQRQMLETGSGSVVATLATEPVYWPPADLSGFHILSKNLTEDAERALKAISEAQLGVDWNRIISQMTLQPDYGKLQQDIAKLQRDISDTFSGLAKEQGKTKEGEKERQIRELTKSLHDLREKQSLAHLLTRVGTAAQGKLLSDPEFRKRFKNNELCLAFVVSIDIRRSTELMLKAREPRLFAEFITTLTAQLREVILDSYGIFDKFTGDGILAFFPDFYSGADAGFRAINAAAKCHEIFERHYVANRKCFISILKDTGLGVGVDFGKVQLVEIGGDFTVVGTPVVYACRMAGAPARQTFVNQPAYESLFEKYSVFDFDPTSIEIKHEGPTLAYSVHPNGKVFEPVAPEWSIAESTEKRV